MKGLIPKVILVSVLLVATVVTYGASFHGWFLPKPLNQPVSLRDGSARAKTTGHGFFFIGGRSHAGGGYRGGK